MLDIHHAPFQSIYRLFNLTSATETFFIVLTFLETVISNRWRLTKLFLSIFESPRTVYHLVASPCITRIPRGKSSHHFASLCITSHHCCLSMHLPFRRVKTNWRLLDKFCRTYLQPFSSLYFIAFVQIVHHINLVMLFILCCTNDLSRYYGWRSFGT